MFCFRSLELQSAEKELSCIRWFTSQMFTIAIWAGWSKKIKSFIWICHVGAGALGVWSVIFCCFHSCCGRVLHWKWSCWNLNIAYMGWWHCRKWIILLHHSANHGMNVFYDCISTLYEGISAPPHTFCSVLLQSHLPSVPTQLTPVFRWFFGFW